MSEAHLKRYLAEFDFRYSYRIKTGFDDFARTDRAIKGLAGKRLTYRTTRGGWPTAVSPQAGRDHAWRSGSFISDPRQGELDFPR